MRTVSSMNGSYRPLRAPKTHYAAEVDYRRATTRAACGRTVDTGHARSASYQVDCGACRRIIDAQQRAA